MSRSAQASRPRYQSGDKTSVRRNRQVDCPAQREQASPWLCGGDQTSASHAPSEIIKQYAHRSCSPGRRRSVCSTRYQGQPAKLVEELVPKLLSLECRKSCSSCYANRFPFMF
jgi:hypothetical protein